MKSKLLFLLLSLTSFSLTSTFAATTPTPNRQDAEILGWLVVLNKNEIAAANKATSKKVNSDVKNYADLMKKDHNKNLQETLKIGRKLGDKPIENSDAKTLKEQGKEELATLAPLKDKDFQRAYIDAMVKGHSEALDKIDNNLMKEATNPEVKKHLEITRNHVEHHLNKAKMIQQNL